MIGQDIEQLIKLLAKMPGFGTRSARRAVLHLLKQRDQLMVPLAQQILHVADTATTCRVCHNIDTHSPCSVCANHARDKATICVIEDVSDLWAMERTGAYRGQYHVLGGVLSALDGITPQDLNLQSLINRAQSDGMKEVIIALPATIAGQTTAHYLTDRLRPTGIKVTRLAHGLPMGGELDYLDDGTITTALKSRTAL
jgi:recombination protein RecR